MDQSAVSRWETGRTTLDTAEHLDELLGAGGTLARLVLDAVPRTFRWASYIVGASFVAALVDVRSWSEAERAAADVVRLAPEVSSARAGRRLRNAAATGPQAASTTC